MFWVVSVDKQVSASVFCGVCVLWDMEWSPPAVTFLYVCDVIVYWGAVRQSFRSLSGLSTLHVDQQNANMSLGSIEFPLEAVEEPNMVI